MSLIFRLLQQEKCFKKIRIPGITKFMNSSQNIRLPTPSTFISKVFEPCSKLPVHFPPISMHFIYPSFYACKKMTQVKMWVIVCYFFELLFTHAIFNLTCISIKLSLFSLVLFYQGMLNWLFLQY